MSIDQLSGSVRDSCSLQAVEALPHVAGRHKYTRTLAGRWITPAPAALPARFATSWRPLRKVYAIVGRNRRSNSTGALWFHPVPAVETSAKLTGASPLNLFFQP